MFFGKTAGSEKTSKSITTLYRIGNPCPNEAFKSGGTKTAESSPIGGPPPAEASARGPYKRTLLAR